MSEVCIITGVGPDRKRTRSKVCRRRLSGRDDRAREQRLINLQSTLKAPGVIRAMFLMKTR